MEGGEGKRGGGGARGLVCDVQRECGHTGPAESIRPSLRNGFTAYGALSSATGFFATVIPEKLASQKLDASTGASRPHAFAVRIGRARQSQLSRPPRVRDDRESPLLSGET